MFFEKPFTKVFSKFYKKFKKFNYKNLDYKIKITQTLTIL